MKIDALPRKVAGWKRPNETSTYWYSEELRQAVDVYYCYTGSRVTKKHWSLRHIEKPTIFCDGLMWLTSQETILAEDMSFEDVVGAAVKYMKSHPVRATLALRALGL